VLVAEVNEMKMNEAIKNLIHNEFESGSIDGAATAYAVAIGLISAKDEDQWKEINERLPLGRLDEIKDRAWKKYEAIIGA